MDDSVTTQHEILQQSNYRTKKSVSDLLTEKKTKQSLKDFNHSLENLINKYAKTDADTAPKKKTQRQNCFPT